MPAVITHVFDASALIAYFKGEEGHEHVAALLTDERNNLAIHIVNLCEVYYGYLRSDGLEKANEAWERATKLLGVLGTVGEDFIKRVARWKVKRWVGKDNLGIGDSFLAACAEEHAAILVTADHNDFDPVQREGLLQVDFIR
ncbi:MAG: PIN domain-containing protein [Terriglobia bacterium]